MQGGCHRPANDAATECIQCDRQIEEASPRRNVRDIGHPQHVRALGCEVTLDQIGRLPAAIAYGRDDEPAATDPAKTCVAHQTGDALLADTDALDRKNTRLNPSHLGLSSA